MDRRDLKHAIVGLGMLTKLVHFGVSTLVIFGLAYLLGQSMLTGPLTGNDSPLHVSYALWLDEYFPSIPNWYPLQGGGESLLHGYPILPHLLVVGLRRVSGLSILQAYRLISFLTFPLIAMGLYLFCWRAFKRQTIGLVAAIFYLLAPVSWTWMFNWGFFSQQVAFIFLPLSLTAFLYTLTGELNRHRSGSGRLWFVVLAILISLAFVSHMMVGAAAGIGMALYIAFAAITSEGAERKRVFRGGMKILLLLAAVAGLVTAAYILPFYFYGQAANREGLNTPPVHQLHRLPVLEFFGLRAIDDLEILTRMQFPIVVSAFAALAAILLILRARSSLSDAREPLSFFLVGFAATTFTLSPLLAALVLRLSPFLHNFLNFRSTLLLVMILMPALAAYGSWAIAQELLRPLKLTLRRTIDAGDGHGPMQLVREGLISVGSLAFAGMASYGIWLVGYAGGLKPIYGPLRAGLDPADIWDRGYESADSPFQQLGPSQWPALTLRSNDAKIEQSMQIARLLPDDGLTRMDISPHEGRLAMDLPQYSGLSQINAYTFQISLIHLMWGYQQNVFFSRDTPANEFGNPVSLNGSAKWFGIEYAVLDPDKDATEMYRQAGWELAADLDGVQLWRYPDAPGLASASNRPTILVIGKLETDSYMTIFRIANDGVLPYDDAMLIEGHERVDDYSLEELEQFDALLLYGHDYRNSRKAWEILEAYVSGGGGLFIDTGWEYWIPEWQFDPAPSVLPIDRAVWTNYGVVRDFNLGDSQIAGDVDTSLFKPLAWEGQPWTLSGAEATDVREWGEIVLSAAGRPLIVAGEYGQGRVVWSGMNLIGHARYGEENGEELRLFGNLMRWLVAARQPTDPAQPVVARNQPDRVSFLVDTAPGERSWLYWREAFYPDWHAYLEDGAGRREVPIYRAGPGFMLMPIESADPQVIVNLGWEPSFAEKAAYFATIAGGLFLVVLTLDGLFLDGNGFTWLKIALLMRVPRPFLGEGPNRDWAERKRRELEAIRLPDGEGHYQPGEAISWWRDKHPGSDQHSIRDDGDGASAAEGIDLDAPMGEQYQELLEAWLQGTGHTDDAWAAKLLGKRQPAREAQNNE